MRIPSRRFGPRSATHDRHERDEGVEDRRRHAGDTP
jgi:hypothetical protein